MRTQALAKTFSLTRQIRRSASPYWHARSLPAAARLALKEALCQALATSCDTLRDASHARVQGRGPVEELFLRGVALEASSPTAEALTPRRVSWSGRHSCHRNSDYADAVFHTCINVSGTFRDGEKGRWRRRPPRFGSEAGRWPFAAALAPGSGVGPRTRRHGDTFCSFDAAAMTGKPRRARAPRRRPPVSDSRSVDHPPEASA